MKSVLSKLKLQRLLHCKTQEEVAMAIGISRVYISHMENGREPIREELLQKLCRYYGCTSADLI